MVGLVEVSILMEDDALSDGRIYGWEVNYRARGGREKYTVNEEQREIGS